MLTEDRAPLMLLRPGWLEAQCKTLRIDPEEIRKFRNALLKRGESWARALSVLPEVLRGRIATDGPPKTLTLQSEHPSQIDGATKFLLRTAQDLSIETVVMEIQSGRAAVCVSSQVGCAVRCAFCATGQAERVHGLSSEEILGQVLLAKQHLARRGRRLRNVVFMGMGEPLLNAQALHESLFALLSPQHFALSPRHVLVSTVGIPHKMVDLVRVVPKIGLALSLHSAQASVRNRLIPLGHRYDLASLKDAVRQCNEIQPRPVMIEYLLLAGVNDSDAAVDALLGFCENLRVRVNLIPYNRVYGLEFARCSDERCARIRARLQGAGLEVTVRRSLGADIAAACGQLVALRPISRL